MKYLTSTVTCVLVIPLFLIFPLVTHAASTDYYLKIGDIKGETKATDARGVVGQTFVLDGSDSKDDSTPSSYSWRQVSGPYTFGMQSGNKISVTPPTAGAYVFELIAIDSNGRTMVIYTVKINAELASSGIEPDEIDYAGSQETNFGVLLDSGGSNDGDEEEKKGNVETEWKVEKGEKAMEDDKGHKGEIDILSVDGTTENATNFGILLGGSDTSEERKEGLERAAEVLLKEAHASDQAIESISLNFEKIKIKTKKEAKFFGVIPFTVLATVEIDESENATVTLPWWAIFVTGVEREEIGISVKETLSNVLKTKHDTVKNSINNIR